jgi:hypothetical protein
MSGVLDGATAVPRAVYCCETESLTAQIHVFVFHRLCTCQICEYRLIAGTFVIDSDTQQYRQVVIIDIYAKRNYIVRTLLLA